jgi:UDPglucose 6-dehydrogenase
MILGATSNPRHRAVKGSAEWPPIGRSVTCGARPEDLVQLCVVGTGYVGLVAGACLADLGHHVVCIDNDPEKLARLDAGKLPIYEPGLEEIVLRGRQHGRLSFTSDLAAAVAVAEVAFIAVGTPAADDGSADLSGVFAVADAIGRAMAHPTTVVIKSTVPVGTADRVRKRLLDAALAAEHTAHAFDVVSNPEFLAEGTAVDDFNKPDRIVVGYRDEISGAVMDRIYAPLVRTGRPILHMDNRSAEMAKYAANAMLAARITFMNEIANLCDAVGADVERVRRVVGSDTRLGSRFLFPGCGYGGSCFPKDVQALAHLGDEAGYPMTIAPRIHEVNERQKRVLSEKLAKELGSDWSGKRIAVWGVAFKPRTDDVREAPALTFVEDALQRGASVVVYDPEALEQARKVLGDRVDYAGDPNAALDGADALVIPTDWNEFRSPDFAAMAARMRGRVIVDGRNLYEPAEVAVAGFHYHCIGRPKQLPKQG